MLALALLIGLQYVVTWSSVRVAWVRRTVTGEPALLFYRGRFLGDALRVARVTEDEVRAAARSQGLAALDGIEAVVLETDGSFSVITDGPGDSRSTLAGVHVPEAGESGV